MEEDWVEKGVGVEFTPLSSMRLIPCPEKDFESFKNSMYTTREGENCGGWAWYAVERTGVYLHVHESIMPFFQNSATRK